MKRTDLGFVTLLVGFGTFIWLRDRRWLDAAADTAPILIGWPLFVWLGAPWRFRTDTRGCAPAGIAAAAVLFTAGVVIDSTLALALSWAAAFWSWASMRLEPDVAGQTRKLLVVAVMSFPWVVNDFERVGWWFRLSGAAATEQLLSPAFAVVRHGTYVVVNGFSLSIEPACSGVNGLQALLVAGTAVAFLELKHTRLFWWNLPLLIVAAWLANVLRIAAAGIAGAFLPRSVAATWIGPLHLAAGWLAICVLFAACAALFKWEARLAQHPSARFASMWRAWPWLETVLVAYTAWRCRNLLDTWFHAPFDRWAWTAFAVWLAPVAAAIRRGGIGAIRLQSATFGAAAIAAVVLGDIAELNILHQVALAFALSAIAPVRHRVIWAAGAIAWMSVFGWIASRFGAAPPVIVAVRLVIATATVPVAVAGRRRPSLRVSYARIDEVVS